MFLFIKTGRTAECILLYAPFVIKLFLFFFTNWKPYVPLAQKIISNQREPDPHIECGLLQNLCK